LWLRRSDDRLEANTKQRYYSFLEAQVPGWTAPTLHEEETDPRATDQRYGSAVRWLLEYTRDTERFPLVFAENISYGFRRNALGLKPFAVVAALTALGFGAFQLYVLPPALLGERLAQIAAALTSLLLFGWWLVVVSPSWVRDAADGYARALLAACDKAD
jgi:hypothetical protein